MILTITILIAIPLLLKGATWFYKAADLYVRIREKYYVHKQKRLRTKINKILAETEELKRQVLIKEGIIQE